MTDSLRSQSIRLLVTTMCVLLFFMLAIIELTNTRSQSGNKIVHRVVRRDGVRFPEGVSDAH
jgi:hypothetical protein